MEQGEWANKSSLFRKNPGLSARSPGLFTTFFWGSETHWKHFLLYLPQQSREDLHQREGINQLEWIQRNHQSIYCDG